MPSPIKISSKGYQYASLVFLSVGAVLRIIIYLQNRSLFIDEGAVASEIVGNNFIAFLAPLKYQFSPPLFSALVKIQTLTFGSNEYALRLVPLLAGIGSLILFYRLFRNYFSGLAILFPAAVLAFAMPFVRYASECKQYSTDVFITILLLSIFLKIRHLKFEFKHFLNAGILGALLIWLSMPVVFTLFGMGIYFLVDVFQQKKPRARLFIMIAMWLISFGIYFLKILYQDIELESLADYHRGYFFPLTPFTLAEFSTAGSLLMEFLTTMLRGTVFAKLLGILLFGFGVFEIWESKKNLLLVLLLPIVACILASGLGYYSLLSRLILFSLPLVLFILASGAQRIERKSNFYVEKGLLIVMIIVVANFESFNYFFKKFEVDEIRPVLEYVHDKQTVSTSSTSTAYIHHMGITAFDFYQKHHDQKLNFQLKNITEGNWRDNLSTIANNQNYPCWIILNHLTEEEQFRVLTPFKVNHQVVDSILSKNAAAFLLE